MVSTEELSQALEEEALSTEEILDAAEQVRRSASLSWSPTLQAAWRRAFPKLPGGTGGAPGVGLSVDRGFTNPKLLGWKSLSPAQRPRCVSGRIPGLAPSIPISWRGRPLHGGGAV